MLVSSRRDWYDCMRIPVLTSLKVRARSIPSFDANTGSLRRHATTGPRGRLQRSGRTCLALMALAAHLCAAHAQAAPDDMRVQAEHFIREHQWDRGLEILRPLLRAEPSDPRLMNLAGLAYTGKGDRAEADKYFEAAIKVDAHFVPALKNLGINEVALKQVRAAREHLEAAAQLAPDDPVVNLYLGEISYELADFKRAAAYLRKAPEFVARDANVRASLAVAELRSGEVEAANAVVGDLQPSAIDVRTQLQLGVALAEAGDPARAIAYFETVLQRYPSAGDVGYDLALCYMRLKRFDEAISALEKANGAGHESSESDNLLAEAYEAEHQTQRAVDVLRRAIAMDPADENNYLEFASVCIDHQAYDDAAKVLAVGLGVHPRSPRLLFERGILNAMQDHFDAAEKDFQQSAELAPQDTAASYGLGVTFLETGKAAEAIPILRKRLRSRPDDADLLYLLSEALLRSGAKAGEDRYAEAQRVLQRSIQLKPTLADAHIELGTIYLQQGRLEPAVNELEQARRLDPKANSAYSHLAIAYRRLGQQAKSREVLNQLKTVLDQERTGARAPAEAAHLESGEATESEPKGPSE